MSNDEMVVEVYEVNGYRGLEFYLDPWVWLWFSDTFLYSSTGRNNGMVGES